MTPVAATEITVVSLWTPLINMSSNTIPHANRYDEQPPPLDDTTILKGDLVIARSLTPLPSPSAEIPAPASSRMAWMSMEIMRLLKHHDGGRDGDALYFYALELVDDLRAQIRVMQGRPPNRIGWWTSFDGAKPDLTEKWGAFLNGTER